MKKKILMQELESYLDYWQEQLRLKDWNFGIAIETDPDKLKAFGTAEQNLNYQDATITILDPDFIPDTWRGTRDIEVTFVHELLHVRCVYCMLRDKKNNHHVEMAIETVAKALVANRRGIHPDELI